LTSLLCCFLQTLFTVIQVRNSGFNIAYAINLAFPISLFRYLYASDWLRVFNLSKLAADGVNDGKGPTMMPVIKMAIGFLNDPLKIKEICEHAREWLQQEMQKTETGIASLQQVGIAVEHKSKLAASTGGIGQQPGLVVPRLLHRLRHHQGHNLGCSRPRLSGNLTLGGLLTTYAYPSYA
jgi:hypothetical protein